MKLNKDQLIEIAGLALTRSISKLTVLKNLRKHIVMVKRYTEV